MNARNLLTSQRHALLITIAANSVAHVDRVGRIMLDGLSNQMRDYVARIDGELGRGAHHAGLYGPNGWAPALDSLIKQSSLVRGQSQTDRKDAA